MNTSSNSKGNESRRDSRMQETENVGRERPVDVEGRQSRARVPSGCVMLKASEVECYEWG